MKLQNWLGILTFLLCYGLFHSSVIAETASDDGPEDVLEAIKSSPIVQAEVTKTRQRVAGVLPLRA